MLSHYTIDTEKVECLSGLEPELEVPKTSVLSFTLQTQRWSIHQELNPVLEVRGFICKSFTPWIQNKVEYLSGIEPEPEASRTSMLSITP